MENENTTLPANGEVTQNGEKELENNQGNQSTQPQVETVNNNEGKIYSQKDLDDNAANTRRATEKETKKKLLAELGLKPEEEDKLVKMRQAYQDSLSDEEKRNEELQNLQEENTRLSNDLEERDYTIKALIELTGKNEEDVSKIVKMAKGLKTDDNTIEDAIKEVISMINVQNSNTQPAVTVTKPTDNPNMPIGSQIQQPSVVSIDTTVNPFKAESINLTKQGQLLRENPELAKKLAAEAGVKLR